MRKLNAKLETLADVASCSKVKTFWRVNVNDCLVLVASSVIDQLLQN